MSSPSQPAVPSSPQTSSDKENRRSTLVMRDKGKAVEGAGKRKRTLTNSAGPSSARRRTQEPEPEDDDEDGGEGATEDEDFDPDQPLEERRKVQRSLRDLLKNLNENNDEFLQPDSTGLYETVKKANRLASGVKQTMEAAIDSRLLVNTGDASYRKIMRLTSGNIAQGLDVDEFVSKCITYMRLGGGVDNDDAAELSSTQRQRRQPNRRALGNDSDDEIGDEGDMFNWEHLGRFACAPNVRRPAVPGFLLGPLSVEKKVRKVVKRSAPFRPGNLQETRPQVLNADDVQRTEKNDLTVICSKILQRLLDYLQMVQDEAEALWDLGKEQESQEYMDSHGLKRNGGMDFFKFVINPKSFGQTVENLFYVSFLIRDGRVQLAFDEETDVLTLLPPQHEREPGAAKHGAQKHQAIFEIDMQTWREVIDAFDIKEPVIEHRQEQSQKGPGARGWYS